MARRSSAAPLRAVEDDETQPPALPKSVAEAAKDGTARELLAAMRDRIAETVSRADCPPRELGVLTKRLQDIVKDIATLDAVSRDKKSTNTGSVGTNTYDPSAI